MGTCNGGSLTQGGNSFGGGNSSIISTQVGSGGGSIKAPKSDESFFRGASIKKNWVEKRNEARMKKERDLRA
jgi:hypothetical protein